MTMAGTRLQSPPRDVEPVAERTRRDTVGRHSLFVRSWWKEGVPRGPKVVMIPGLGMGGRMLQPVAGRLAQQFRVEIPDLPGFGRSSKPGQTLSIDEHADVLAEWLVQDSPENTLVAGVSIGSQVALALAHRHPRRCWRLCLVSPTVDASRRSWAVQIPRWQAEQFTQSLRMRGIQITDFARCGVRRVLKTFAAALRDRPEQRLAAVHCPTVICWASRDPLVSRWWAENLADLAPDGQLTVVPGGVHVLSHENPVELSRIISHHVNADTTISTM